MRRGFGVVVSTIHKAKGREYDDVYMMISDSYTKGSELMRRYYVGMTRAKRRLFIHTNGDCFDKMSAAIHKSDPTPYSLPDEIVLQLSHKDVFLDFFKRRKHEILSLRSGDELTYNDNYLYDRATNQPMVRLSQRMQQVLSEWKTKGYNVKSAFVRFVVAWKPKTHPEDNVTAVLLPDLHLSRLC